MAETPWDPEHLEIVRKGADAILEWHRALPSERMQLTGANLIGAYLRDAYLRNADLRGANLRGANLRGADLRGADLRGANFRGADLRDALLSGANLSGADLSRANLSDADLIGADLIGAYLNGATLISAKLNGVNLSGANLTRAFLYGADLFDADLHGTTLCLTAICTDLTSALNLDAVQHSGPSPVDFGILGRPTAKPWPVRFLRGCGLSEYEIEHVLAIAKGQDPIQFYSCFISYSSKDDRFAVKLHDALQARGIRCWLDKHEVLPGDNITAKVNDGIRLWDKVLLCCTEQSLTSWWVKDEVVRALEKERKLEKERGHEVLAIIPLDLDGYLLDENRCMQENAPTLRKRHAPRFRGWEADEKVFDAQLERMVKALRCDEHARLKPPPPKL